MAGLLLALTVLLEVAGAVCMKLSAGLTLFWPSVGIFVFYAGAFATLAIVLKSIDLSVAYAIWAGAGTALIAIIGIVAFGESVSVLKIVSLCLVVAGVIGLQLS